MVSLCGPPTDVGHPLTFSLDNLLGHQGVANVVFGPVNQEELQARLGLENGLPEVALFIEIDVYVRVGSNSKANAISVDSDLESVAKRLSDFTNTGHKGLVSFLVGGV